MKNETDSPKKNSLGEGVYYELDAYSGTYVVRLGAVPIGTAPVHFTCYNAAGFSFTYTRVRRPKNGA